jgi:hypothetical protein
MISTKRDMAKLPVYGEKENNLAIHDDGQIKAVLRLVPKPISTKDKILSTLQRGASLVGRLRSEKTCSPTRRA